MKTYQRRAPAAPLDYLTPLPDAGGAPKSAWPTLGRALALSDENTQRLRPLDPTPQESLDNERHLEEIAGESFDQFDAQFRDWLAGPGSIVRAEYTLWRLANAQRDRDRETDRARQARRVAADTANLEQVKLFTDARARSAG
jgi:hypothetical protein